MEDILSKTLVTGSNGMVGSYVDFGIKTDRNTLDITDYEQVERVIKKYKPQVIFHLAAETDVDKCERDPLHAFMINSIGTYNLVLAAKKIHAKFIYVSTASVFEGDKDEPYTEEDIPNPQSHYSRSKYLGEKLIAANLDNYLIIRPGWMFGGGPDKDHKFVGKIISLLDKKEIKAVNDKFGSPTYAKDLIEGIKELLRTEQKGIYHVANKGESSRYDVASYIVSVLNPSVKVVPVDSSYFNLDAKRVNSEAIETRVDFMRDWRSALKEYLLTEWGLTKKKKVKKHANDA
jgi:dTDP-4-dehydrorhamnose reductase